MKLLLIDRKKRQKLSITFKNINPKILANLKDEGKCKCKLRMKLWLGSEYHQQA